MGDQTVDRGLIRPDSADPARVGRGAGRSWLKVPVAAAFLGLVTIIALLLVNRYREMEHQDSMRTSALMDVSIYASEFHLWFEEYLSGDATVDMEENWKRLDHAHALVDAVLNGGKTDHDLITRPLSEARLRKGMTELSALLDEFRGSAKERLDYEGSSGAGTAMDQLFDAIYMRLDLKTRALEAAFDVKEHADRARSNQTILAVMAVVMLFAAGVIFYILFLERRRRQALYEREMLIAELQDAMDEIKTLSGILPVCAWCKKIRDDRGSWQKMETYVLDHTEAEFTHGICPDCVEKQNWKDRDPD